MGSYIDANKFNNVRRDTVNNKRFTDAEINQIMAQKSQVRPNENSKNGDEIVNSCIEPNVRELYLDVEADERIENDRYVEKRRDSRHLMQHLR